jgi:hypothetical protein
MYHPDPRSRPTRPYQPPLPPPPPVPPPPLPPSLPGYHYELNPRRGNYILKRPFSWAWYFLLPFLLPGIGLFVMLVYGSVKEPNPTGRLLVRVILGAFVVLWVIGVVVYYARGGALIR